MEPKEIAKDIIVKMIEHGAILRSDFPQVENYVDVICLAYKKVLKAVQED